MYRQNGLTQTQREALDRMVAEGELSADQAGAVRAAFAQADSVRRAPSGWLVEVAGYLGGVLLLAAAGLFLSASWDSMTRPVRGWLLAGFALVFVLAAGVVAGGPVALRRLADGHLPARRRLVGLLLALACVPAGWAAGIAVHTHAGVLGTGVALAVAVAGFLVLPTVSGVLAMVAASWFALMTVFTDWRLTPLTLAWLSIGLAAAWCVLGLTGLVRPRALVLALGLAIAVIGAQSALAQSGVQAWAYGLTAGIAVVCFLLYRWVSDIVLLAGGILAATIVVPEAVSDVTNGALGGSAILLIAGVVLLGLSAVGLHLRATAGARHRPA